MHPATALSDRLFAELVLTALAAERRLRPYVGELGADPMLFRSFGTFGKWQEIPHPSRFVRERSEDGDRVGELYTRMIETDANMAALWEKRVKAVLALPRTIRAADSSPEAEEIALFIHTALALIPLRVVPISNILEAIVKGVAINEILWERMTRGPLAGAWLPVDVIDRPMWRFGWSATDKTLHVVAHPGRLAPIPAPPMKFQVLSYGTKDNPWGRALLDRLYWVWYLKRHASKYWSVFVERFAQPLVKGTYPYKPDQDLLNKEHEDRMLAILNTIRTGSSIALPEGLDIAFLEASRGGDASYFSFVSWLERAQALLMLGEVDTSGLARGAGSFAKALISNEVRLETVQHDAHLLGSFESDTLIRWMVLLNFGPDAPIPKSLYDGTDAADRSQRMQGITKALNDGVAVPMGYYRMTMRVPAPLDREPVVERPATNQDTAPEFQGTPPLASLSSLSSFSSLRLAHEEEAHGDLVEARDHQLQAVAAHFAPALTGYFAAHLDRLLILLDEDTASPLDQLVAGDTPATAVDAIATAQIHAGGLALLHAREDLGALRLSSPDDWQGARTPAAAIDFWAAHLGLSQDFFLTLSSAARRIAAASTALAEGPLLADLHEVLERARAAGLDKPSLQGMLRQTYEAHGLLPTSPHHADLVLANNVQQTAHAVRYLQTVGNPAAGRLIPYLVWWTVGDDRVRQRPKHNHTVMHNRVFAIDHPIWKTWWPPAGHNCRCGIGTITAVEARRLGYVGSEPTGPWPTAPATGGPALPDPGFHGAPDLDIAAEDLEAKALRIAHDAQLQGGDLQAAITRLFAALGLKTEVKE
jgi:phage gp29-like protein